MFIKAPLSACLILLGFVAETQHILRYQFTHLSPDQGLSSTYVRKIVQDPYGFIWAGTQDGLNRFDGKKIKTYNKSTIKKHSIAGADIRDLAIDSVRSTLWVITSYGGINGIDYRTGNVWFTFEQQNSPQWKHSLLNSLALVNNDIYIGSSEGLLRLNIPTKSLQKEQFLLPGSSKPVFIDRLLHEGEGTWIITEEQGIFYCDLRSKKVIVHSLGTQKSETLKTYDAVHLQSGEILLATNHGLQKAQLSNQGIVMDARPFPFIPPSFCKETFACCKEKNGNILLSNGQLLIRVSPGTKDYTILAENSTADTEKWLSAVFAIYVDPQRMVWLGCQQGLAFGEAFPSPFYRVYQSAHATTRIEHAYYLYPANDSLLFCCAQDGLYKVNVSNADVTALTEGTPFYHVFKSPLGDYLVSSRKGLFVLADKRLVSIQNRYPELEQLGVIVFNSHVQLNDSVLVLGTQNFKGVVVWNYKKRTAYLIHEKSAGLSLKENAINGLYLDKKKNVWVLGDRSITMLDKDLKKVNYLTPYNPHTNKYYSIFFDVTQVGSLFYMASYGNGVVVLDSNLQFIREMAAPEELSANSTYKTFAYRDSLLFVTSNNGITVTNIKAKTPPVFFYKGDGLHSNTFEENSGNIYNDKIYAGGEKGLTIISPALFREDSLAPRLFLDEVSMENADSIRSFSDLSLNEFDIPNNVVQTTLYFAAIHFQQSTKTTISYKIDELNEKWISLGTNNFIQLIGIPHGTYTIYVKATNSNGIETTLPLKIKLRFLPKWYQTWWFKIMIVLLVIAVLYAIYWYRMMQLKKQEEIRREIANDLHDDIGGMLTAIALLAHMAKTRPGSNEYLQQLEESIKQTSASLRDIIWVLDDTADTLLEFMERLKKFAQPLCNAKEINLHLQPVAASGFATLNKEEKRNLMLIAKESINNAIKYADCSTIQVKFEFSKRVKKFTITDNGKGFDINNKSTGYGLKNMKYRAKQLTCSLTIQSSNKGTVVEIVKKNANPSFWNSFRNS